MVGEERRDGIRWSREVGGMGQGRGVVNGRGLSERVTEGWGELCGLVQTGDRTLALFLNVKTPPLTS